jgi:hypothetical protein
MQPDPKKPLFDDDDDGTAASQPGDLPPGFGDDEDATEYSNPRKDLPFKPEGLGDEDDEATKIAPPAPKKK